MQRQRHAMGCRYQRDSAFREARTAAAAAACTLKAQGGMEAGRPAGSDTKLEARDGSQSQITHWRTLKSADLL